VNVRGDDAERATIECPRDFMWRKAANADEWRDARGEDLDDGA
jgi:hypothetical protein